MKLVHITDWRDSTTKIMNLNDLKDQDGNDIELPPDPENNLVFDPRPIDLDSCDFTFDIEIRDSTRLVATLHNYRYLPIHRDLYFRVYDRTKEDVPAAFDSSVPYEYWGLNEERAPVDTVVVKVHPTATAIKKRAFSSCKQTMTTCDMSNAPVEEIEQFVFCEFESVRSILFPKVALKKIGHRAFNCIALDVLVIPSTVTNIQRFAFNHCRDIRILKLPDLIDLDHVTDDIIEDCDKLEDKVPAYQTPQRWLKHRYDPYPLHKVCYNAHVTVEEIQQCIQRHPHAAYLSDELDMTALHMITIMACTSNLQTQSNNQDQDQQDATLLRGIGHITACFDANMSAAFAQDDKDKTPLDYLLESCHGLDVHTALVTCLCLHRSACS